MQYEIKTNTDKLYFQCLPARMRQLHDGMDAPFPQHLAGQKWHS